MFIFFRKHKWRMKWFCINKSHDYCLREGPIRNTSMAISREINMVTSGRVYLKFNMLLFKRLEKNDEGMYVCLDKTNGSMRCLDLRVKQYLLVVDVRSPFGAMYVATIVSVVLFGYKLRTSLSDRQKEKLNI